MDPPNPGPQVSSVRELARNIMSLLDGQVQADRQRQPSTPQPSAPQQREAPQPSVQQEMARFSTCLQL